MTSTELPGAAVPKIETDRKSLWARLMDYDLGIIPLPIYVLLLIVLVSFTYMGKIKGDIAFVIGIMAAFAFTLGEIGKRLPVVRNIGGAAVVVTFVPSYLAWRGWIPEQMTSVVETFFKSTGVLYIFIAAVIVGSILSMERTTLIKGFMKIFVPLAVGSVCAAAVGTLVGTLLGLGTWDTFFFVVAPIMAGGVGEGAIPLSVGYHGITGMDQGEVLARVMPAILVGNLTAIICAGALSSLARRRPDLTGNGKLQPGGHDDLLAGTEMKTDGNVQNIAAAGMIAVTLYLTGALAQQLFAFPAPVVMLALAVAMKLFHGITPRLQSGSYTVYKFCLTAIAYPMLFAFGIVLTPWEKLIEGFAPANLITIVVTVVTMTASGYFTARLVNLYPIEAAIVSSTHSGMGGAGDIAILSASNRMMLMPFAQIATRIGGGITVALALILMAMLA
ncbi:2-hydroxycarboxylate transporter family protein [Paracoccus sp. DMF-8]|uniref:2-hydroxycarboxylate transporter family protein n=1 Tax=Paracoccus sp. DMF-8 TaxID=3019445 RepID=UPI0023E80D20|nr:2-hydroxycarboxylate transporter family protein [Paracoccus sp. DMF-8]MDF3606675.1 2-hydroxycarboxylate transporter family protein [Paracoccus sp. DMF-8]